MENNNVIGILVIIALLLACVLGTMFIPSSNAQMDSKLVITSNKTLHEGDNLTVKLTDLNRTPIEDGTVNITISDKNGKTVAEKSLSTNSKGKARMELNLDPGKYTVNATFEGNDNFTGNNTTQKLTIKEEEVVEQPVTQQASSSESSAQSGENEVVSSRDFESWDYAPGYHIHETTYANGDIEREIEGGYYSYYDSSEHREYYTNPDGSSSSMSLTY